MQADARTGIQRQRQKHQVETEIGKDTKTKAKTNTGGEKKPKKTHYWLPITRQGLYQALSPVDSLDPPHYPSRRWVLQRPH
jgi:hypothetical protein